MNDWKKTQSQWVEVPQPLPKHLIIAQGEVGVRESNGPNNGIPSEKYMGGRKEPWCAHFIAWLFRTSGNALPNDVFNVSPTRANPLAGVQYMEDMFKKNGWWFAKGNPKIGKPEPGDIIFYRSRGGSDSGRGRHVGLVERVDGGYIYTIEGNLGDAVKRNRVFLASNKISGFGRVP